MKPGEALAMFVNELGATVSVVVNRSTSYTSTRRYVAQSLANDIGTHTTDPSTGLVRTIQAYEFPYLHGKPVAARVALIWDRPSLQSAGHRTFLRRALAGLGVDPSQVANIWAYPFSLSSPPLETHILQYLPATIEAIHASGAQYVVLLGGVALKIWRRELQVQQVMGKMGVMNSTWFTYVMPNPIVPLSDQLLMAEYRQNLRTIVDIIHNDSGIDEFDTVCIEKGCREDDALMSRVFVYDPDGLPWCRHHWRKGFKRRLDHKSKTASIANQVNQERLL